jgi:hypothetical protein
MTKLKEKIDPLKSPRDFRELKNLDELIEYENALKFLNDNITIYRERYIQSMLLSISELLETISFEKLKKDYSFQYYTNTQKFSDIFYMDSLPVFNKEFLSKKIFLLDTKNKKIEICGWCKDFDEKDIERNFYYKNGWSDTIYIENYRDRVIAKKKDISITEVNGGIKKPFTDSNDLIELITDLKTIKTESLFIYYEGFQKSLNFDAISLENKLILSTKFTEKYEHYSGGIWINGCDRGYYRGFRGDVEIRDVFKTIQIKYVFCLKTNKFLGRL